MSQVLALKYRPSSFDKLIGQEAVTQTLTLALSGNRLSHAYLFSGLRGSGKTSTARIFSKALVCDLGPTATPCNVCENCKMANENRHMDIIEMDAASSRKIDDIRDVIEQTKYKPTTARFKIFIIDEVHMLTREAFNALLKTLEEPPAFVKFILATTDPLKLPATILSRTQHFRFKQIGRQDIVHHLSHILNLENIPYEIEALEMLSRAGNGSLRDTLTLLDQAIIFSKGHITPTSIASMLGLLDPNRLESIFHAILKENRKEILELIKELETYECEVILDELIAYVKDRFFEQDTRFSMLLCERFFRILSEAKNLLFINADSGFVLSLVFFKMMEAINIKTVDEMIKSLENEKFRIPEKPLPQATISAPRTDEMPTVPVQPITPTTPVPQAQPIEPLPQEDTTTSFEAEESIPLSEMMMPSDTFEEEIPSKDPALALFQELIAKLYDREYGVGECFEKSIDFLRFEEDTLFLASHADEECKPKLRHASGIIKHFVKEVFGFNATISMQIVDKPAPTAEDLAMKEAEAHANESSSSMMEDQEFGKEGENTESCATGHITRGKREIDAKEILEDPFIQRAQELFDPKKIQIRPKI